MRGDVLLSSAWMSGSGAWGCSGDRLGEVVVLGRWSFALEDPWAVRFWTCTLERSRSRSSRQSRSFDRSEGSTVIIPARICTILKRTGSVNFVVCSSAHSAGSLTFHLFISYSSKGCSRSEDKHSATSTPIANTMSFSPLTFPEAPCFINALSSGAQCRGLPMEAAGMEVKSQALS